MKTRQKRYSYLFSILILFSSAFRSVRLDVDFAQNQIPQIVCIKIVETSPYLAAIEMLVVAYLLGCPVNKITEKLANNLGYEPKD